jgi:2-oxoglutarate dehydrogenase E1 component
LLLCSGKVFYNVDAGRRKQEVGDVAVVRVEQLYPFPQKEIQAILAKYRSAQEVVWVQDEPRNRGAWMYMQDRLQNMVAETQVLKYVGREEAASPATGSHKLHEIEAEELLTAALDRPSTPATQAAATVTSVPAPTAEVVKK